MSLVRIIVKIVKVLAVGIIFVAYMCYIVARVVGITVRTMYTITRNVMRDVDGGS